MHSTACGVGASAANSQAASLHSADGLKMLHSNDDAMNKVPLKSMDDEEKNGGGEFIQDTETAEEARREQRRAAILHYMKKLTLGLICFIGVALIAYVIFSLCFNDWPKNTGSNHSLPLDESTNHNSAANSTGHNGPVLLASPGKHDQQQQQQQHPVGPTDSIATIASTPDVRAAAPTTLDGLVISTTASSKAAATASTATDDKEATPTASTVTLTTRSTPEEPPPTIESSQPDLIATTTTTMKATEKPTPPPIFEDVLNDEVKFESVLGVYKEAAVCSDKQVCSDIGSHILSSKGSAVDAAIAMLLCNGITTLHSMGIGGGMLMNVYIKETRSAFAIDAREVAPFSAFPEMFDHDDKLSINGGLAIAVPGELMGYYRAHERYGRLPWKQLVEPSIELCKKGFHITPHQFQSLEYKREHLKNDTLLTDMFFNPLTSEILPVGTKVKPPPALCDTYQLLADNGALDFYNGTLAQLVAEDLKDLGSPITTYDLDTYMADLVNSISMQLGDDTLYALPPVSSGTVVANVLSILEGYNFSKADLGSLENEALTVHRFAEALKFGFAKRWELGDLRFNDVRELVSKLTNPAFSIDIRGQINDSTVLDEIYDYGGQFQGVEEVGTSQISVVAPNGDAVAVTSSINDYFGSGQMGKRTGIIFNSAMNDFSIAGKSNMFGLPASPSNFIDARKRPMSSMSPMILTDPQGNVRLTIGAAGGSKIISSLVGVIARVLWLDQDIKQAIDAPRFHHQLVPNVLEYQKAGFDVDLLQLLRNKGHLIKPFKGLGSVVCGIVRNETALYTNADYRKRGGIAGF